MSASQDRVVAAIVESFKTDPTGTMNRLLRFVAVIFVAGLLLGAVIW